MRLTMRTPSVECLQVANVYLDGVDVTARGVLMLDTDKGEVEVYKRTPDGALVVSGNNQYYETEVLYGVVTFTNKPTPDVDRLMQTDWPQHTDIRAGEGDSATPPVADATGYEGEDGG